MTRADEIRAKLDEIKAAIEKAQSLGPLPWKNDHRRDLIEDASGETLAWDVAESDAHLIILAVNMLPGLVELAEAQVARHDKPHYCPTSADPGKPNPWYMSKPCPVIERWHALLVGAE
jgi:hypothetical protein